MRRGRRVRKAVFPAAGLGTRFLPATKSMPKEMITLIDKPLIQYAIDEAREAGIEEFIFVTGRGKSALEDYFDYSYELNDILRKRGRTADLEIVNRTVFEPGSVIYTRQQEPLGLGHAIWCARNLIKDEPFAIILADDVLLSSRSNLKEMIQLHAETGANVVGVLPVPASQVSNYGIIDPGPAVAGQPFPIRGFIEKPAPEDSPSSLAIIGRYILTPEIFLPLSTFSQGHGHEIQLTDAMNALVSHEKFLGHQIHGKRFDCGSKVGLLEAIFSLALRDPELKTALREAIPGPEDL